MKREDVKKLLENGVLQAYAEGKAVQVYESTTNAWHDSSPSHDLHFNVPAGNYRVKPEPLHDWVVCSSGGRCYILYGRTPSYMEEVYGGASHYTYRQLVPVTEEV